MNKRICHKVYVKVLIWLGLAIDIHSKGKWPSNELSNFYPHRFKIDCMWCGSMEGFLQALKYPLIAEQREICALTGKDAKMRTTDNWKESQILYWNAKSIKRDGDQFQGLVRRAYRAMLEQCLDFCEALKATSSKKLFHSIGNPVIQDTILTEKEFCQILDELRAELINASVCDNVKQK